MNGKMEFDHNVSKLAGVIMSLRRRKYLSSLGPNEEELKELKDFFDGIADDQSLLKLVFFLILNTDLKVREIVKTNENLCPLVCIFPPLNVQLTVLIILKLKLQKHFNDIIKYCSSSITENLLILTFRDVLRFTDDIEETCDLWCSIFTKILSIDLGMQKNENKNKLLLCFYEIYYHINKLFELSLFRRVENKNLMSKNVLKFFESILFMVRLYNDSHHKFTNDLFNETYNLAVQLEDPSLDELSYGTELYLFGSSFSGILYTIKHNFWVLLSELEKEMICETCFHICEETKNVPPGLLELAKKVKPKSALERILTDSTVEMNFNLLNRVLKSYFFTGLTNKAGYQVIKETETVVIYGTKVFDPFREEKLIDWLIEFFDDLDVELMNEIIKKLIDVLKNYDESIELESKVKKLFLSALKRSNSIDYETLFRDFFVVHPKIGEKFENGIIEKEKSDGFEERLIKTFNQSSAEKFPKMSELAELCLESRTRTLSQICKAATFGPKQSLFYSGVVHTFLYAFSTSNESNSFEMSILEQVLINFLINYDFSEQEERHFLSFYGEIKKFGLMDWPFYSRILDILNDDLKMEKHGRIIFLFRLMQSSLDSCWFIDKKFSFLVFMSQILESLSWDLENFSTSKCQGMELAQELVSISLKSLKEEDWGSNSAEWAAKNIRLCSEMTRAHFAVFWSRLGHSLARESNTLPTILLHCIHSEGKQKTEKEILLEMLQPNSKTLQPIIFSLAMLIPRLTYNLWMSAYGLLRKIKEDVEKDFLKAEYQTIGLFSSAIYLLTLVLNNNPKTFSCYEYCLRNFGQILKGISNETKQTFSDKILKRVTFFLQKIKDDGQRESSSMILLPALIVLFQEFLRNPIKTFELTNTHVYKAIKLLKLKKVEEAIYNALKYEPMS